MAKARLSRIKEDAQRIASLALALLRARAGSVAGLWVFVAGLPVVRRSRPRREIHRLYRRFMWLMSDGYNFEVFYSTQLGAGHVADQADERRTEQLPGKILLAQAHDLTDQQQGGVAMRVLIGRAVRHAAVRGEAATSYRPTSHTLHAHWLDTIEAAFSRDEGPKPLASVQHKAIANATVNYKERSLKRPFQAPVMVDEDAFELNTPELVPYRASTRH